MEQAVESSSVSMICFCFSGKAGVAMTIVCRSEPVHGCSIHTPPALMPFILPAGQGGGCKDALGEMLEAALQLNEKLRPSWGAPFPKEYYFWEHLKLGKGAWFTLNYSAPSPLAWTGLAAGVPGTGAGEPAEMLQTPSHSQAPLAAYEHPKLN